MSDIAKATEVVQGFKSRLEDLSGTLRQISESLSQHSSTESDTQEAVAEMAGSLKKAYSEWPEGHEMYAALPGALAALLGEGVACGALKQSEAQLFLEESYAEAGHDGHPHIKQVARIYAELERLF